MALPIRTLIVDDEALARERIRQMLNGDPEVEIIGECSNGQEAVTLIADTKPDLVFLDVQMPRLDGFGVLKKLDQRRIPAVIFVTAYDEYAVRAFEVHATDYLLKPFKRARFQAALGRVKEMLKQGNPDPFAERTRELIRLIQESPFPQRLAVHNNRTIRLVNVDEIDWIESDDNYARLHVGKDLHLLRETLTHLEQRLDPRKFLRVHRRAIVNLDKVREFQSWFRGGYRIVLTNGTEVPVSRQYRNHLRKILEQK